MTRVPADLPVVTGLSRIPAARLWLDGLPALIEEVTARFGLRTGPPLHGGSCSWVAHATLTDGTPVTVKIGWPHREMLGEPVALRLWDGDGAVRLLHHDPVRHALVLQRCVPGHDLGTTDLPDGDRLRIGCAVLRRLWLAPLPAPGELEPLTAVATEWADRIEDRLARRRPGYDRGLVVLGASLMRSLPRSADAAVVLHGDLNPGNILAHGGQWLAIDPKPMTGDPAYDPWSLLTQVGGTFAEPAPMLRARALRVAADLGIEAGRMVQWSLARRVEAALWSADHGNPAEGAEFLRAARDYADLADRL